MAVAEKVAAALALSDQWVRRVRQGLLDRRGCREFKAQKVQKGRQARKECKVLPATMDLQALKVRKG
jgi:hypothetical protein